MEQLLALYTPIINATQYTALQTDGRMDNMMSIADDTV